MAESRSALIVANWDYKDPDLRKLMAPANDAEALARVLRDPNVCGFEVTTLLNQSCRDTSEKIEAFFLNRKRDDLLLLYFSCHGIKDDDGHLYFAAPDTRLIDRSRPMRSTALSAEFVQSVMRYSNSRRQVLMLDCCYSGAFASAMMGKGDKSVGVKDQFEQGRGMVVITASDALQYSFENDGVQGESVRSVFTGTLVKGIESGEADHDRDGTISLDELYDYVYEKVLEKNPNQHPRKWTLEVEGKIIVAQTPVIKAAEIPQDLLFAINSPLPRIRIGAVNELGDLLKSSHKGLALAAHDALLKLATDDSRQVSAAAETMLGLPSVPVPPQDAPVKPAVESTPAVAPVQPELKPAAPKREPPRAAPEPVAPPAPPKREAARPVPKAEPPKPPVAAPKREPVRATPKAETTVPPARVPDVAMARAEDVRSSNASSEPRLPQAKTSGSSTWSLGFPWTYIIAIVMLGGGVWFSMRSPKQSTDGSHEQKTTSSSSVVTTSSVKPIELPRPPFEYFVAGAPAEDTKVRLVEVSETPNQIIDEEEWFGKNDLTMPTLTVPNSFKQEAGNIPAHIPVKHGDDILAEAIKDGDRLLCMYGRNFGEKQYVFSYDLTSGKPDYAFNFHEFLHPPKYLMSDRDFVEESLRWASVKDGVLYVSNGHSTYAKSSYGQNAYLNAIDIKSGQLLWRSAPLVSNSANFLLYGDAIITGYGFTAEPHFLYVVNQKDGRVVQTIKMRKMVSYILAKGDSIYVRAYDTDYVFKATSEQRTGAAADGGKSNSKY